MSARRLRLVLRRALRRSTPAQMLLIAAVWLACDRFAAWSGLPIPGAVLGVGLILLLLAARRMSLFAVRRGARWLLGEMLLFFVPAVLAIWDHPELFGVVGLKVAAVIAAGVVAVMGVTFAVAQGCVRLARGRGGPVVP